MEIAELLHLVAIFVVNCKVQYCGCSNWQPIGVVTLSNIQIGVSGNYLEQSTNLIFIRSSGDRNHVGVTGSSRTSRLTGSGQSYLIDISRVIVRKFTFDSNVNYGSPKTNIELPILEKLIRQEDIEDSLICEGSSRLELDSEKSIGVYYSFINLSILNDHWNTN